MDNTETNNNTDFSAKYPYTPYKNSPLEQLKEIGKTGSVENIRKFIKQNPIVESSPILNNIVKIEGYKFMKRRGKLLYVKDTEYQKLLKENDIHIETAARANNKLKMYLESIKNKGFKPTLRNRDEILAQENQELRERIKEVDLLISFLMYKLEEVGISNKELEEEIDNSIII